MHTLNVFVSRTDTWLGSCIRRILGGDYNHCSFSFDENFSSLFAYSRLYKGLWFTGCFCTESVDRYLNYEVFQIEITDEQYKELRVFLVDLSRTYRIYNYLSALVLPFGWSIPDDYHYLCSTFVARVLECYSGVVLEKDYSLYRPMDVYNLLKELKYENKTSN